MRIAEIFHSIQGEGSLLGVPSIFVRTSGCNLRCTWCDTPYASWEPEGPQMSVAAVTKKIEGLDCRHLVLTGGEPMVAAGIDELASAIHGAGRHITIETAATVPPNGISCDLASLSPKLSNSAPGDRLSPAWQRRHDERRWQPDVVRSWIDAYPFQLKFVICSAGDLAEMETMVSALGPGVAPDTVFLMPEGITTESLRERAEWLVDICRDRGYRYGYRLQIELFGNTRGT